MKMCDPQFEIVAVQTKTLMPLIGQSEKYTTECSDSHGGLGKVENKDSSVYETAF